MNELLDEFHASLVQEGLSRRTCAGYAADIRKFLQSVEAGGQSSEHWRLVGGADIGRYLDGLARSGAPPATSRRARASIRKFFQILIARGELTTNPADALPFTNRTTAGLSEGEVLCIFRFLRLRSRQVAPRKAMADEITMFLLMFTGLRMKHLSAITPDSFITVGGALHLTFCRCPGLLIDGPVRGHVSSYLKRYGATTGRLFPGQRKVRQLLQEIGSGLGISLDPHVVYRTHLQLRQHPELALSLLSRIEDIHE